MTPAKTIARQTLHLSATNRLSPKPWPSSSSPWALGQEASAHRAYTPEGLALQLWPMGSSLPVLIQSLWLCSTGLLVMALRQGRLSELLLVMVKRSWLQVMAPDGT
jgi:hypothetical protein